MVLHKKLLSWIKSRMTRIKRMDFSFLPQLFFFFARLQSASFTNRSCDRMTSMIRHKKGRKECVEEKEKEEKTWSTAWQKCFLSSIAPLYRFVIVFLLLMHPTLFWRQSIDLRTWLLYLWLPFSAHPLSLVVFIDSSNSSITCLWSRGSSLRNLLFPKRQDKGKELHKCCDNLWRQTVRRFLPVLETPPETKSLVKLLSPSVQQKELQVLIICSFPSSFFFTFLWPDRWWEMWTTSPSSS